MIKFVCSIRRSKWKNIYINSPIRLIKIKPCVRYRSKLQGACLNAILK